MFELNIVLDRFTTAIGGMYQNDTLFYFWAVFAVLIHRNGVSLNQNDSKNR